MKRLHSIIYQETIPPSVITLVVLTFVVFTREFGRLAEILIRKNAELVTVTKAIVFLLPSILIFTVPFSFLIGTLIGFSRMSADSEVVAMRAGGVSVRQMLWPVLKLAITASLVTGAFTLVLLPEGNWQLRSLRNEIRVSPVQTQIKPRVFYEEFPDILVYVQDVNLRNSNWDGIFVADNTKPGEKRLILADRGWTLSDGSSRRLQLHFERGTIYSIPEATPEKVAISNFATLDLPIDLGPAATMESKVKRPRDKTLHELWSDIRQGTAVESHDSIVEFNRRIALPVSPLIFAILGVVLGSGTSRGGRGHGFFLSVVVAFSYYVIFATGSSLSRSGVLPVYIGVWGANLLLGALALLLLRYGDTEMGLFHRISNTRLIVWVAGYFGAVGTWISNLASLVRDHLQSFNWIGPSLRPRVARVIDLYMVRIFLSHFLAALLTTITLVCLFTFFEIIDDIFDHDVPYSLVFDYFFFLQPHLLMLLIPISALIATMVTFGTLEKSNQIVALKSCGVSIYRLVTPVIVVGLLVSGFIFVMQEQILPYANQRQDNLRNIIKGSPVQTSQPGRHWIFGEDGSLYNYSFFSSKQNLFAEISAFQLNIGSDGIKEYVYANRAVWDRDSQSWRLRDGWVRDFKSGVFQSFEEERFRFPEKPSYFDEEVRESSKMTYLELKSYVEDLQTGGFEVDYLKTELFKKVSFPLVSVVMVFLGLPFALTIGRKGALYGIAIGIILGIVYWGAFGIFDVLGSNGLLAPELAAWGPNVVFGTGAAFLISGVRS